MNRVYRTKLNIKNKKTLQKLKEFAGVYRYLFNHSIEWQFFRTCWNGQSPQHQTTSLNLLTRCYSHFIQNPDQSFLHSVESGTRLKALKDANLSYKKWFDEGRHPLNPNLHISKKRNPMRFSTQTPIKIHENYITLPKVGKLKLYERNYLPKHETVEKASFEFDGKYWWVTVETSSKNSPDTSQNNGEIYVDFNPDGSLVVDNKLFKNITESKRYKKVKAKRNALSKKYRRQKKHNTVFKGGPTVTTSKNMLKTRAKIQQLNFKLDRIKKDYFRKITCALAKTKPSEVHVISENVIKTERQNYLTRKLRESGLREFFSILTRKMQNEGITVVKHQNSRKYHETLSHRASGAIKGVGEIQNFVAVKQELVPILNGGRTRNGVK